MKLRIILLTLLLSIANALAAVNLPSVISDGMVLQRDMNVPIWGWGNAGEKVTVAFGGQTVNGVVGDDGAWKVVLKPLTASAENRVMTITVGKESVEIKEVLVGEVWVCSGQSNMQFTLGQCTSSTKDPKDQPVVDYIKEELESSFDPLIRQIRSPPRRTSDDKELTTFPGSWSKADSAENKKEFTAVGYYFAKELRAKLDVPVGLLNCSWGGKKIQPFIPSTQYKKDPKLAEYYEAVLAKGKEYVKDPKSAEAEFKKAIKEWKAKNIEAKKANKKGPPNPLNPFRAYRNLPSMIYNAMVNPLVPFAIRGAIWYQGEANTGGAAWEGFNYDVYLRNLIDGWRDRWGQGDFSFYYCQLAQFRAVSEEPVGDSGWANTRNDMRRVLDHKNVGMAVLSDIGEEKDIHPRNKVDVGKRLALWALAKDYGQDIVYSGPLYKCHTIDGKEVKIQFDSVGEGLMVARKNLLDPAKPVEEELGGFQIVGKDGKWLWAKAKISGKAEVTVWHDDVTEPVEVRYAWAPNPIQANLYNKAGLPTSVFSTK